MKNQINFDAIKPFNFFTVSSAETKARLESYGLVCFGTQHLGDETVYTFVNYPARLEAIPDGLFDGSKLNFTNTLTF